VFANGHHPNHRGAYLRLVDGGNEAEKAEMVREAIRNPDCGWFYRASVKDFWKIPGNPIAYWISDSFREIFRRPPLSEYFQTRLGLSTANNDRFLRNWHEVPFSAIGFGFDNRAQAKKSDLKWFPYEKGGAFRKWYGNHDFLVNWKNDGDEIRRFGEEERRIRSHNYNLDFIFKEGITWSDVTSGTNAFRYMPKGFLFDGRGSSGFVRERRLLNRIFGFLNSKISTYAISAINPTVAINVGEIAKLPFPVLDSRAGVQIDEAVRTLTDIHKNNWDSYEVSWDFVDFVLLQSEYRQPTVKATYKKLRARWREITLEMQRLEEENNRIFVDAYGLQDELTPEVPLSEITLTCNPHYRYNGDKSEEELEALLLADTMKEFISYAVGCMFGRYALDKPGLILANQGETIDDYLKQIPDPTFPADDDNVIPMLDGNWFTDDITERFYKFLRVTFGEEHYEENLKFIEQAIGKDTRKYFLKDFYADHVKRYKKLPIYWLFSSPKGSFNALIYMHRYRPDTVSVVLNDYLREFRAKLASRKDHLEAVSASATAGEKTRALKEIEKINKMIAEMEEYERDVLYPLATEQVEIDLDDGVKVNYNKFGAALKKITGLSVKGK
ncbi:BREX-1 system adenine-specific DNA-methyltransferase PglX, partial [Thiolapillus sp.]|uniref:BREX-1 system adenine-specific DNA-methyltransferase PglX n=1 Tax=Thiolapillus sp. TaxID=2017437 RepID=UPI003AF4738D